MKKNLYFSVLFLLFSLILSGNVYAYQNIVRELNEQGKKLYQKSMLAEAAAKFESVLQLDADNITAREYLARIHPPVQPAVSVSPAPLKKNVVSDPVYVAPPPVSKMESEPMPAVKQELLEKVESQSRTIEELQNEIIRLQELSRTAVQPVEVQNTISAEEFDHALQEFEERLAEKDQTIFRHSKELELLQQRLAENEALVAQKEEDLTEQDRQIEALRTELAEQERVSPESESSPEALAQLEKTLTEREGELFRLRTEILNLERESDRRNTELTRKDDQIATLKNELKDLISQAGQGQEAETVASEDQVVQQELLDKTLNVLHERDKEIERLTAKVNELESGRPEGDSNSDQQFDMIALREALNKAEAALAEKSGLLNDRSLEVERLKKQMTALEEKLTGESVLAGEQSVEEIADLQEQVKVARLQLFEVRTMMDEKDQAIAFLQNELDDLRERLELAQNLIEEKDQQIKELQEASPISPESREAPLYP